MAFIKNRNMRLENKYVSAYNRDKMKKGAETSMLFEKFKQGINLGGFLSQYEIITGDRSEDVLRRHFETFITEADIGRIASWGFDHVRIPMDGYLFWDRETKMLRKELVEVLDRCLAWCAEYHLSAVIDLHNITGHVFGQMEEPTPLMTEEDLREEFCSFWEQMAEHFAGFRKTILMFELFNEMADATGYRWNQLYQKAIRRIREKDSGRWILVGTNYVNSVSYLNQLELVEDPYVFYNFHYYEPNVFTHQRAHFSEEFSSFGEAVSYPGSMEAYQKFLEEHPQYRKEHPMLEKQDMRNDRALMLKYLEPAEKFVHDSGRELYCGEYGVIDSASETEAVKWLSDFIDLCSQYKIGHAMWNYKCLDFELVDLEGNVVRPKVLELLNEKNR